MEYNAITSITSVQSRLHKPGMLLQLLRMIAENRALIGQSALVGERGKAPPILVTLGIDLFIKTLESDRLHY